MKDHIKHFVSLASLFVLLIAGSAVASDDLTIYKQALRDLRNNDMQAYDQKKARLKGHPLYAYLEYEQIRRRLQYVNVSDIRSFSERFPTSSLTKKLNRKWLDQLVKRSSWHEILDFTKDMEGINASCLTLLARHHITGSALDPDRVKEVWTSSDYHPKSCQKLFERWALQDNFDEDFVWQQFSKAMSAHNISFAKTLDDYMPEDQQALAKVWLNVHLNWRAVTKLRLADSVKARQVIAHGISRYASRRPLRAVKYWNTVEDRYNFSEAQKYKVFSSIALRLATRQNALAEKWMAKIPTEYMGSALHDWNIRTAMIRQDWKAVLRRISLHDDEAKQKPIWRYWKAHAYLALGQAKKAKPLLEGLVKERHFYSILASHALKRPIQLHHAVQSYEPYELMDISQSMGMQRVKSLFKAKQFYKARVEWNHVVRDYTPKQKYLAAVMADTWGWHEKAIHTLSTMPDQHDLKVRFPTAHKETIDEITQKYKISTPLIFALIRQESSFKHDAHSHAGALGIMQLMPKTAKRYNKRLKIDISNASDLHNVRSNIMIGCAHFKDLMRDTKNQTVHAIAAYNAGMGNVKRWLRQKSAASTLIWIETIPFKETRNYLKNIITYSAIYHNHLGIKYKLSNFIRDL